MLRTQVVVVHHPASDGIDDVRELIHPPFTDVPYDFVVDYETGAVWRGRALTKQGAHVIPDHQEWAWVNNRTAMGIAFEGNFHDDIPPIRPSDAQIEHGAAFLGAFMAEHQIVPASIDDLARVQSAQAGIVPHRLVSRTACPGRHFMLMWDEFVGKVRFYYSQAL